MAFSDKNVIFRPYFELEAIARQSVEASREVICAYFGNIGKNSGYFLHPIFLAVHPNAQTLLVPGHCITAPAGAAPVRSKGTFQSSERCILLRTGGISARGGRPAKNSSGRDRVGSTDFIPFLGRVMVQARFLSQ